MCFKKVFLGLQAPHGPGLRHRSPPELDAVMKTAGPALPELHHHRTDQVATPVIRARHRGRRVRIECLKLRVPKVGSRKGKGARLVQG